MDTTITFTPSELVAFIGTIAGVCAGIATITGFIVALVKRWKERAIYTKNNFQTFSYI